MTPLASTLALGRHGGEGGSFGPRRIDSRAVALTVDAARTFAPVEQIGGALIFRGMLRELGRRARAGAPR